jgi:hypothetical protein
MYVCTYIPFGLAAHMEDMAAKITALEVSQSQEPPPSFVGPVEKQVLFLGEMHMRMYVSHTHTHTHVHARVYIHGCLLATLAILATRARARERAHTNLRNVYCACVHVDLFAHAYTLICMQMRMCKYVCRYTCVQTKTCAIFLIHSLSFPAPSLPPSLPSSLVLSRARSLSRTREAAGACLQRESGTLNLN